METELKAIIFERYKSLREFSIQIGMPYSTIDSIFKRGICNASAANVKKICLKLCISADMLLAGRIIHAEETAKNALSPAGYRIGGAYERASTPVKRTVEVALEPYMDEKSTASDHGAKPDNGDEADYELMPCYNEPAAAGYGNYLDDSGYEKMRFKVSDIPWGADMCVRISGDSMEPEYSDGDIVFVKACPMIEDGNTGIFVHNGEALCKKLKIDYKKREIQLVSLNSRYQNRVIDRNDDLRTVGRVLGRAEF